MQIIERPVGSLWPVLAKLKAVALLSCQVRHCLSLWACYHLYVAQTLTSIISDQGNFSLS